MNFGQAIKTVFSKYAVFEGRATRPEYWWWYLFVSLVNIVLSVIAIAALGPALRVDTMSTDPIYFIMGSMGALFFYYLVTLALIIPTLAVLVRRLRDTGRKAWYLLLVLVPVAGYVTLFVITVLPSKDADKK